MAPLHRASDTQHLVAAKSPATGRERPVCPLARPDLSQKAALPGLSCRRPPHPLPPQAGLLTACPSSPVASGLILQVMEVTGNQTSCPQEDSGGQPPLARSGGLCSRVPTLTGATGRCFPSPGNAGGGIGGLLAQPVPPRGASVAPGGLGHRLRLGHAPGWASHGWNWTEAQALQAQGRASDHGWDPVPFLATRV